LAPIPAKCLASGTCWWVW